LTCLVERECCLMPSVQFVSCHFTGPWFVLDQHAEVLNHWHNITCTCFVIRAHYPNSVKNQSLLLSLIGPYLAENPQRFGWYPRRIKPTTYRTRGDQYYSYTTNVVISYCLLVQRKSELIDKLLFLSIIHYIQLRRCFKSCSICKYLAYVVSKNTNING